ncbi:MAG: efflux RND transporter periplasmic adaptor subunit [Steroidobacteraceae bacterium]
MTGALGACTGAAGNTGKQSKRTDKAIPVTIAPAKLQTVPYILSAVGNLIAVNSAVVRTRVDAQLLKVEFNEGDEVKAGQVLFRLDARPYEALLAQAKANLAKDEATLERNRAQRQRYDNLMSKDYVSADDYAQIKANEQTAAAAVIADQAAVQAAQLNLDYCTIRAPISGRSGTVALRAGNLLKAADAATLVTITQLDPVYVDFTVPQQDLDLVRRGMLASKAMVSLATDDGNVSYAHTSKLDFIDNTVDAANGTVHVRATVVNGDHALWPSQFVHVHLQLDQAEQVVTVPGNAVGNGPDGSYVFTVDATLHVHQRTVTVSRQTDSVAIISQGVAAGDEVVSDGQSRLQDGSLVQAADNKAPEQAAGQPTDASVHS